MNIVLLDGTIKTAKSPIGFCTGYKATSLVMKRGDFLTLLNLSKRNPSQFNAVMLQLEGRLS